MEYQVFQYVPSTSILEQFERIHVTILLHISILLLWNDGHQCMELILCRVVESSCLPTHNIVPHISWHALVSFGLLTGSPPGANTFPPEADSLWSHFSTAHPLPATPFQCPQSRTATLGLGTAAPFLPLRWPDCTLSRLRAEEYDRWWPSRWRPRSRLRGRSPPGSDADRPPEPWVCHHTREPTVLSRENCRPFHLNFDRFHQPCLLPGRTSRWGLSSPYHVAATYPFLGSPALPPSALRLTGGFCHADWTVPRHDVNSSFPACVCHTRYEEVFAHTQVRDPCEYAAACWRPSLGTPSPWPPSIP